MGSKKDEKQRILMLDVGIVVDLKEMLIFGTEEFEQRKIVERKKNGTLEGGDVKIFFKRLHAWLFER